MSYKLEVVAGVWTNSRFFSMFRKVSGPHAGFYEFPGGKIEAQESPKEALKREIFEELGLTIQVGPRLALAENSKIRLSLFEVFGEMAPIHWKDHDALVWLDSASRFWVPINTIDEELLLKISV